MTTQTLPETKRPTTWNIIGYSLGEGAGSLVMNSINGFALLFYTDALGLPAKMAGLALSLAVFWDAITDPAMGYISDNSRSRFGRRHSFMLLGGIAMAVSYYFIWAVPDGFRSSQEHLFWYLVIMNIIMRTAVTVFVVPYVALGFEVCTDYQDRSKLQGIKFTVGMLANFAGPALAWKFFFADVGETKGTSIASNFNDMAVAFTIAVILLILATTWLTRQFAIDSRSFTPPKSHGFGGFFKEVFSILSEKLPAIIFSAVTTYIVGVVLVGSIQMYVYVHFMQLTSDQKVFVHGMGMVSGGIGALVAPAIAKRLDKKATAIVGIGCGILSNILMWLVFITFDLPVDTALSIGSASIPVAVICFVLCQGMFWGGNAILQPITYSMIADVSQIRQHRTGELRDGSYSAMLSLIYKVAIAVGILISGYVISGIGYEAELEQQTSLVVDRLMQALCISGIVFPLIAGLVLVYYPVNKARMEALEVESELKFPNN
ncbi:MFS transporter [Pelagicoccus mobilis]|uniref:MFS transporter n=1 Tax=Pelagicoccus mobilis TaxID=415221 RepID=A0A934VPL5_9BACT|nr:MFS transporter [Pelagicoccus mobilis]MBK1877417.1 MFS transporter [Pelagicoccus mobilis]